jgi:hypothetical protein
MKDTDRSCVYCGGGGCVVSDDEICYIAVAEEEYAEYVEYLQNSEREVES